jgi:hypothetical protein
MPKNGAALWILVEKKAFLDLETKQEIPLVRSELLALVRIAATQPNVTVTL